jgi:HD superfamily phosphohydrolase YqeK
MPGLGFDEMKDIFRRLRQLAAPYLNTRRNDIHTDVSVRFAYKLMEKEGGDEDVVIPAVILHDVGWKKVPKDLHLKAYGPHAIYPDVNRIHEVEGAKIAAEILRTVKYNVRQAAEVVAIIEGHDSRKEPLSLNDRIVKDADKLYRYSHEAFYINLKLFELTVEQTLARLGAHLSDWFLTDCGKRFAEEELKAREEECNE